MSSTQEQVNPGGVVFLDFEHPITTTGLTTAMTNKLYLIVVDEYSYYLCIYGPANKSTKTVMQASRRIQLC